MMQVAKKKSMALTTILAFLCMGVGHIYLGKIKRGLAILVIGLSLSGITSAMSGMIEPQGESGPITDDLSLLGVFLGIVIAMLSLFVWQLVDARQECRKFNGSIV